MVHNGDRDLPRTVLSVGAVGALIVATTWILWPFLTAFLWAAMIVISTWPLLLWLQRRLWGKRGMAAGVLTTVLLLVLLIPLGFSLGALISNFSDIVVWVRSLADVKIPPPPEWVSAMPLIGAKITAAWQRVAAEGSAALATLVAPYGARFVQGLAARMGGIGSMILQFLITVIASAVLYVNGETAAKGIRRFAFRLSGSNGDRAVVLAANSVRGVAMGIVGTALSQTVVAGIGLAIASIPGALLLAVAVLIVCLAQIPPLLVLLPAVIWKFYTGSTVLAFVLLAFTLVASLMDNVLRPILIRKGADLPLMLVFTGVIGGMISLGIIGIFVGPVILAVTYNLLESWVENPPRAVGA